MEHEMQSSFSWPQSDVDLLGNTDLVPKAHHVSAQAYVTRGDKYRLKVEDEIAWISFPGTVTLEDVVTDVDYGICLLVEKWKDMEIPVEWGCKRETINMFFQCYVHSGFTARFCELWNKGLLLKAIEESLNNPQVKNIVFAGHSLGGAIACLATVWFLYLQSTSSSRICKLRVACITFGMPFVGDKKLSEVVQSQGWDQHLLHVVSRHDVIPRVLLAPLKSISKSLQDLIPFWNHSNISQHVVDQDRLEPKVKEASKSLIDTLKRCAIAAYAVHKGVKHTVFRAITKVSPYRPFGNYLFCTNSGASCLDNPITVLQMLHLTLQRKDRGASPKPGAYCVEHTLAHYGSLIREISSISKEGGQLARMAVEETNSVYELEMALQLEVLGIDIKDIQTRLVLMEDRKMKQVVETNAVQRHAELVRVLQAMARLEWFKTLCEKDNKHYYDVFKSQENEQALEANINRMVVISFWDETLDMYSKGLLPPTFKTENKWVNHGHAFRLLVEPLDIANYYRLGKREDTQRSYLSARPRRYKELEAWYNQKMANREQVKRTNPPSLTQDSTLFAKVEEAARDCLSPHDFVQQVNSLAAVKSLALDLKLSTSWSQCVAKLSTPDPFKS